MPTTTWLWIAAALYLLFEIWRGWRRGVVRHGVSVFALLTAGGIGWVFAWMTGPISDRVMPFPVPVGRVIFGVAAGLAFYLAAVVLSSLLFKKTSQQGSGVVRLVYGLGGGFFGLIFGLVVLWGGISMVRMLGAMEEGRQVPTAVQPASGEEAAKAQGFMSRLVDKVDPVPPEAYGIITKLIRVTRSPEATARFFHCPEVQRFLSQPKIAALLTDPEVMESASGGNIFAVLANPQLASVAGDPGVQKAFAGFDIEKALDYALQTPPTSPAP